jgi:hypothetical protein
MSTRHIRAYFEANRRAMAESRELPVAILLTFLGVSIWESREDQHGEPMTMEDLAAKTGHPATTLSQHMAYLGDHYREGKPFWTV